MNQNRKKNIVAILTSAFLLAALIDGWPYGFFTLLRLVVFTSMAYMVWMVSQEHKGEWIWIFGFLAILFNPFIPIRLNRDLWRVIDLIVGVFLLSSVFTLKFNHKPKSQI